MKKCKYVVFMIVLFGVMIMFIIKYIINFFLELFNIMVKDLNCLIEEQLLDIYFNMKK